MNIEELKNMNAVISIKEIYADGRWKEYVHHISQSQSFDWDGFYPVIRREDGRVVDIIPADSVPASAVMLDEQCRPTENEHKYFAVDAGY